MKTLTHLLPLIVLVGGLSLHAMDNDNQLKVLENQLQELTTRRDALQKEFTDLANFMGPDDDERPPEPRLAQLWQEISTLKGQQEAIQTQIEQKQEKK
jgi:prefoldin subunit 5